ncbi:hypothetical protein [Virgisporangium aurantiacum]|nr:hypothetical protein [Virgisporangium aurantiacum]
MTAAPETGFRHVSPRAGEPFLHNATRYLCAATYLNPGYADDVIAELLEDEQRAVAPSYGYDVAPVLLHGLRARRLALARDAALTLILIVGLWQLTAPTTLVLMVGLCIAVPLWARRYRGVARWKITALVGGGVAFLCFGLPLLASLMAAVNEILPSGTPEVGEEYGVPDESALGELLAPAGLLVLVIGAALFVYNRAVADTLINDMAPGVRHDPPAVTSPRVAARVSAAARAQHGNVVLHAGFNPFPGAGTVFQVWSMVLELRAARSMMDGGPQPRVDIDPIVLNRHVKQRLAALRGEDLAERERLTGLAVRDQLVALGTRNHQFPLIDPQTRVPFSFASRQTMSAVICHPQGAARHFLRVTTGTQGQPVIGPDGDVLLPAVDQEIEVSAFVHVAVEGGMLYLEFVSTVLGPIRESLHVIDRLQDRDPVAWALLETLRRFGTDLVAAPVRLVRGGWGMLSVNRRMDNASRRSAEPAHNFGARKSIRESVSRLAPATYTAWLDAHKYSKLFERRVTDAILDFLEQSHVDTGEYRARVNVLHNQGTILQNSTVTGAVAGGAGAAATTMGAPAPVAPGR